MNRYLKLSGLALIVIAAFALNAKCADDPERRCHIAGHIFRGSTHPFNVDFTFLMQSRRITDLFGKGYQTTQTGDLPILALSGEGLVALGIGHLTINYVNYIGEAAAIKMDFNNASQQVTTVAYVGDNYPYTFFQQSDFTCRGPK